MPKNLSAKYYSDNKEQLQKKAGERYQSLEKMCQCGYEWYQNLPENEKQKLVEYKKKL